MSWIKWRIGTWIWTVAWALLRLNRRLMCDDVSAFECDLDMLQETHQIPFDIKVHWPK